ncbi:MAG: enoyl-CoA hydratase/isomerase family protein [Polyangiales bacterium]
MSDNVVPWSSRIGAWQARLAARRALSLARGSLGLPAFGAGAPAPVVKHEIPPLSFDGEALRWRLVPHEGSEKGSTTLEVEMHREPCNEIGTTCLTELEKLATLVRAGAGGASALLFFSSVRRGFSAGADLRELHEGLVAGNKGSLLARTGLGKLGMAHEVRGFIDRIHAVFNTLDMAPITTIAAVHGVCFGGGFELALTADIIVADKSARFAFPELRLGLVPGFGGIPRLRRDLGNAVVRDILLTGRSLNAKRAREVGLVSQVVARGEAVSVARKVAEQAGRFDAATTARAKAFTKTLPHEELEREKDLFIEMMGSPVVEAALRRFVESTDVRPYLP